MIFAGSLPEGELTRQPVVTVQRLVVTLLIATIVAVPLGGITWEMLSDLISGKLTLGKAVIGVPVMFIFVIVLRVAASALAGIDASHGNAAHPDGDNG